MSGGSTVAESTASGLATANTSMTGDWPIYRGNSALQGVVQGSIESSLELAWTFETGGPIISSPVVVDGIVYVGSSDNSVYAVDLASGEKRWSFETQDMVDAPPLVHEGQVYVGSMDFFLYALDAKSGELAWKYETGDQILGGANWVSLPDGSTRIVVGGYDYKLYGFDAAQGEKVWEYQTDNYVNGTPAILGDQVVFGGCDAVLHVVSAVTGEPIEQVALGADCHVVGSVALAGGKAYFGHYANEFVCVDLETGELDWAYPSPRHGFYSSPAIGPEHVVFGGRDKLLHCVRRVDGQPLWTFPTNRRVDGSPVICGDKVIFGSGDGRLYVLDLQSDEELWKYEIGQPVYSSPAVANGMVVVGSDDGRLYAFRAAPGKARQ